MSNPIKLMILKDMGWGKKPIKMQMFAIGLVVVGIISI
jgi:hypothetical protein